jgi:hypothetical protein
MIASNVLSMHGCDNDHSVSASRKRKCQEEDYSDERKLIGSNGNGSRIYECKRCIDTSHTNYYSGMTRHLHNTCFSKKLSCKDCPPEIAPKLEKVGEIFSHNIWYHQNLETWQCIACGSHVPQNNFIKHFGLATNVGAALDRFSDYYSNEDVLIGKDNTSLDAIRKKNRWVAPKSIDPAPYLQVEGFLGLLQLSQKK